MAPLLYSMIWNIGNSRWLTTKRSCSIRGRTIFQRTTIYDGTLWGTTMTWRQLDILGNWKHITQSRNTTGGLGWDPLWKTMCRDVDSASNSGSIGTPCIWPSYLIIDLPLADRFDSILVMVDQGLSKGVILIPCNKTLTAEDTGQLLQDNLYKRFGLPDKICTFYSLSSTNWWNNWTDQSRNWNISGNLLFLSPWNLDKISYNLGIHSQ